MGWKDTIQEGSNAPATSSGASWKDTIQEAQPKDNSIAGQMGLTGDARLKMAMGNFDDFQKLSPEEQKRAFEMQKQDSAENSEALARGLGQGATLGFQDELSALAEKGISKGADMLGLQDQATTDLYNGKSYEDLRDTYRQQNADAAKKAPGAYLTGNVVGGLPLAIASGGGAAAAAKAGGQALQLGRLGQMGLSSAANIANSGIVSGVGGAGYSNKDTASGVMDDALHSAKTGAAIAVPFEAAGLATSPEGQALLGQAGDKIKSMASRAASKTLGLTPAQLAKLDAKGQTETLGRILLDNDVVTPFATAQSKADKLATLKRQTGEAVNSTARDLDQKVATAVTGPDAEKAQAIKDLLNRRGLTDSVEKKTLGPLEAIQDPNNLSFRTKELLSKVSKIGSPADESIVASSAAEHPTDLAISNGAGDLSKDVVESTPQTSSQDFLENYGTVSPAEKQVASGASDTADAAPGLMSFEGTNKFKQNLRDGINYNTDSGASAKNIKNFTRELNDESLKRAKSAEQIMNSSTENGVTQLGETPLSDKFVQSNKDYGAVSTGAKAAAGNAAKRELAKTALTTGAFTGAGYALNGKKGAAEGAALSILGKYGAPIARNSSAVGLDKLGTILKTAPEALGTYAPILQNAAARGSASLAATNFVLQQRSPEYRQAVDGIPDSSEEPQQ